MKIRMTNTEWKEGMNRVDKMLDKIGMRKDVSVKVHHYITLVRIQLIDLKYVSIKE